MSLSRVDTGYVEHFRWRVLQDALNEATSLYWRRRAAAFDAACSKPNDYQGRLTPEVRVDRDAGFRAIAAACRARADLAQYQVEPEPEVLDVLEEVA